MAEQTVETDSESIAIVENPPYRVLRLACPERLSDRGCIKKLYEFGRWFIDERHFDYVGRGLGGYRFIDGDSFVGIYPRHGGCHEPLVEIISKRDHLFEAFGEKFPDMILDFIQPNIEEVGSFEDVFKPKTR
tara:strand:+ start:97 stop:492 length:396 start_codon:yes stop_codon:yes gene_type:complete